MLTHEIHPSFLRFAGADVASNPPGAGDRAWSSSPRLQALPVYLGLDPDSKGLAWARATPELGPGKGHPECGTRGLPPWTGPNGKFDPGVPLARVEDFVVNQILEHGVTHVFSEAPFIGDTITKMIYQLFTVSGAIATACVKARERLGRGIYWDHFTPAEWRSEFIGSIPNHLDTKEERRAWYKAEALRRCEDRGWPVASDHEAEACGVLNYGLCLDYPNYTHSWDPLFYTRSHS